MQLATSSKSISIPKPQLKKLVHDYEATAKAAHLSYINDTQEGITREKKGKTFHYFFQGKKIDDVETLDRIKKLAIPPAWQNVWICPNEHGHIQVIGHDTKDRKQYRYHPDWVSLRDQTKYYRLRDFGRALPTMREKMQKDLKSPELTKEKVLAAVVSVMERTNIRVGNSMYEKLYGSFGLSTMKDKHVKINGGEVKFSFKGKKGVYHNISLKSKKLANIISKCRDIPGQELFQYFDANGKRHGIDSGEVNNYIKQLAGGDFTSKDFRTWSGTVLCFSAFREMGNAESATQAKKNVVQAMDKVSKCLGNTKTVCKKHYVHPIILAGYETKKLEKYWAELDKIESAEGEGNLLTPAEQVLLKILEHS